jgi:V8-like Glu-specific endopeptidase
MQRTRGWHQWASIGLIGFVMMGCSDGEDSSVNLPHFNDVTSATSTMKTAANAVVRLHLAGSYGTGSYISSTGLVLTNNHVLGAEECPAEGCFVEVNEHYQRGEPQTDAVTYRAKPVAIDVGLDVAVVQLEDPKTHEKPSTPDYLEFDAQEADALIGQHVTIVGHPEGTLKKWTDGTVLDATGKWVTTSAYILPGDSGSPILNDAGKIVGLIHRGPASLDLITDDSVNTYSVGSASAAVKLALDAPLPSSLISVADETTAEKFLTYQGLYLNAHTTTVTVGGTATSVLDIFATACDAALNGKDYLTLDSLTDALSPCFNAQNWIECREELVDDPDAVACPPEDTRDAWRSRFQAANAMEMATNGIVDYATVTRAIAQLETSQDEGVAAGAKSLKQVLTSASPSLNYELAYYLSAFAIPTYDDVMIRDYVLDYAKVPGYELSAQYIAYGAYFLAVNKLIGVKQLTTLLKDLLNDPNVSIGNSLSIEELAYNLDAL